jgi:hypothetical protein
MTGRMTMRSRILLIVTVALALMLGTGCGHYVCHNGLGDTTCASGSSGGGGSFGAGGGGGGGGGGGTSAATAYAYAVDQNGVVDGYALSTTGGTFQAISNYTAPAIPPTDPGVGMVVANQQFVYAMFELTDVIYGWSINSSTGALTPLPNFPMSLTTNAPLVSYNEYNIATNPAGTLLFIGSTGADEILVFQISSSGALTPAPGSPLLTSFEPWNVTTDGLGKYLYVCQGVSGHTSIGVAAYSIGTTGQLTAVPGSPFTSAGFGMWQLQPDPSGQFMIGTTGNTVSLSGADDNHLYVFSIAQTGANAGAISPVGTPFNTVYSPFTIATQPAASGGEFVYSFGLNDAATAYNPIEGFSLNTTTGALQTINGSPFSNISTGSWGQFDQSGSNLLVYSNIISNGTSVTQLGPLVVNSDGSLQQAISPVTLVTPGYWVVTNP